MRCLLIDTIAESPGSACRTAITNPLFASGCRACYSLRRAETTRLARHCCKLMSPILCMTGASADGRYRESFREACRVYTEGRSPAGGHGLAPPAAAKRTHCSVTPASPSQGGTDQSRHGVYPPQRAFRAKLPRTLDSRAPMPIACMREFLTRPA